MSKRIDHVAAAREWVDAAEKPTLGMHETSAVAAVAQVHATLALVEQQRIANLIALGQYRIVPTELARHRTVIYTPPTELGQDDWPLRDDIREGLGL